MKAMVVVGGQYGDEGKGKVVSHLATNDKPNVVARAGVGPNAGHQVWVDNIKFPMSMLPSGFVYEKARLLIGAGVLVNPTRLLKEIDDLKIDKKRVGVDSRSTVITQAHIDSEKGTGAESELSNKIGTTKTGCGPAMADRVRRVAKLAKDEPVLAEFLTDVAKECNEADKVLVEATQGFMISLLYGGYPFVTSKDTSASTAAADVGIGPLCVKDVVMVVKSYTTRVGAGPFAGEISNERAKELGYDEYGTVTGRQRRVSESLNFDELKYAAMINSANHIALTKLDTKFKDAKGITVYDDLPFAAREFVEEIEAKMNLPVSLVGTGPNVNEIIDRR